MELKNEEEQLEEEINAVETEIAVEKKKVVSAKLLTKSLTTFGDLYRQGTPEDQRDLIHLQVKQIVWTPDEIRLALLDPPSKRYQKFDET